MFNNLNTKENRLNFSKQYEVEAIKILNNYFAKDNFSFVSNNNKNKYDIDTKIFKNGEFYGYAELKSMDPTKNYLRPYFSELNGTGTGPNLFINEYKRLPGSIWYIVFDFANKKIYVARNCITINKMINFDNTENVIKIRQFENTRIKYFTDKAFDLVFYF